MIKLAKIYILKDPITQEVRYVGKTSLNLHDRLLHHLNDKHKCHRVYWLNELKNTKLKPIIEQIDTIPEINWPERETYWIKYYKNSGYNLVNGNDGGKGGQLGRIVSLETKEKIRQAALIQFSNPKARLAVSKIHKGKIISEKQKIAVSIATRKRWNNFRSNGLTMPNGFKEKLRQAHLDKKLSNETKLKISNKMKNRKFSLSWRENLSKSIKRAKAYNSFVYEI